MRLFLNILIFFIVYTFNGYASNGQSLNDSIIGKWAVCLLLKKPLAIECNDSNTHYQFDKNGSFVKTSPSENNIEKLKVVTGHWNVESGILSLSNAANNKIILAKQIIWLNNNAFYYFGREGKRGPKIYTLFQRLK